MSKNLPETQPSEEIDLGQLFKLIGNAFERLFKFIGNIFYKLFLVFVWGVFFTKRHFWKLVIAVVIGAGFGFVKKKLEKPTYKITTIIKQNYDTGEHLYNMVAFYNDLFVQRDSLTLTKSLGISNETANKISSIEIASNLTENRRLQLYNEYLKSLDSVLAIEISYKDFIDNSNDYDYDIQKVTLRTNEKGNYTGVLKTIIDKIADNEFYKSERSKIISRLYAQDTVVLQSLEESKALQEVYKEVLKKSTEEEGRESRSGTTNITFEGEESKVSTKEYELVKSDITLRRELVNNKVERKNAEDIIETISIQEGDATLENKAKLFGIETSWMISLSVKLALITFVILLLIELINYLERYKDEVS
jgi:large-conductance mechanosensitive channel